ncbi:MAG: type 4a pilus biogenesis protein PilO [Candidatus Omnitrophota bacterium]
MKKLTQKQVKIIIASTIVVLSLFCFIIFIYAPQNKQLRSIKKELSFIESQIEEINKIMQGKELTVAAEELNSQLMEISSSLPANQKEVVSNLSSEAKALQIEIKSINPQEKRLLEDKVTDYHVEELPIAISMRCEYRALGEFLEILRDSFPFLVRVKKITIKREEEGRPNLDVSLNILAYLSKSE